MCIYVCVMDISMYIMQFDQAYYTKKFTSINKE